MPHNLLVSSVHGWNVNIFRISIADVNITVRSSLPISMVSTAPGYKEFLGRHSGDQGTISVNVTVEAPTQLSPPRSNKLFDGGDAWSLHQDGDDYLIVFSPAGSDVPVWIARCRNAFRDVSIFCGSHLLIREGGSQAIQNPLHYPLDQILLTHVLAQQQGLIVHAAGITVNGKGYVFPGKSGAGKSTITSFLNNQGRMVALSDDRIIIRRVGNDYYMYGTPWPGEVGIARNIKAPLRGIFFIFHGDRDRITEISPGTAVRRLLPAASIPWYDKKVIPGMLDGCGEVVSNVPIYDFYFKPGIGVTHILEKHIMSETLPSVS